MSSLALFASSQTQADSLDKLAGDFWSWRAEYAPFTGDDVNRMQRPGGSRDWSRASIDRRGNDLEQFESRWKKIDPSSWPIAKQVDYKLIGSALLRMRWKNSSSSLKRSCPIFRSKQRSAVMPTFGFCGT